jgi:hypothetical protein
MSPARLESAAEVRARLERELVKARARVEKAESLVAREKNYRDALIVDLRRLEEPPSLRFVADLAGVSNPWVLKLERGAG